MSIVVTPDGKWQVNINPATMQQASLVPATLVPAVLVPASVVITAVTQPPANQAPPIPASGLVIDMLKNPPNPWQGNHDLGTPGDASGTLAYPTTAPDGTPNCAHLLFNTIGKGGMIYHGRALNTGAHNYNRVAYRKREMKTDKAGWSVISCCETDVEVTNPLTGTPYDMALQQDANDQQVDITILHKWTGQGIKANPTLRLANQWYESAEFWGFDDATGQLMCFGVEMDGVYFPINKAVSNSDNATWGKDIANVQLQYDGNQMASIDHELYLSLLTMTFWKV